MLASSTPEQEEVRAKWAEDVCELMSKRFGLPHGSPGMAMIRMMAEVASYSMFCRCGVFSSSVCIDCMMKGSHGVQAKTPDET